MRLSEAMRLGAMAKPQAFHGPDTILDRLGDLEGLCALASAAYAVGHECMNYVSERVRWPVLNKVIACPVAGCTEHRPQELMSQVWHLNDHHRWSREQIADVVALYETSESATSVDAVDPVGERVTA